jgi:hypothetical protein
MNHNNNKDNKNIHFFCEIFICVPPVSRAHDLRERIEKCKQPRLIIAATNYREKEERRGRKEKGEAKKKRRQRERRGRQDEKRATKQLHSSLSLALSLSRGVSTSIHDHAINITHQSSRHIACVGPRNIAQLTRVKR